MKALIQVSEDKAQVKSLIQVSEDRVEGGIVVIWTA